jgi:glucose/mannose-6-phosphate isomerase
MKNLILHFPQQLLEAIQIGKAAQITLPEQPVQQIFIAGMGGSGIGANFVAQFIGESCLVPVLIGKGYDVPAWVGRHTLAIVSSYSGNTEETIDVLRKLQNTGARIVCITSGGRIRTLAKEGGNDIIQLPEGIASPRACLGYSIVNQLFAIIKCGLAPEEIIQQIRAATAYLKSQQTEIMNQAESLAEQIHDKLPIIYCSDHIESVAIRWRQQLNENSKILCWHHVLPEMNHNELVGWHDKAHDKAVVFIRDSGESPRISMRFAIIREVISKMAGQLIEVEAQGDTPIVRTMYLVHLGDWLSYFLAQLRGVDVSEIAVIDFLKRSLSESKSSQS